MTISLVLSDYTLLLSELFLSGVLCSDSTLESTFAAEIVKIQFLFGGIIAVKNRIFATGATVVNFFVTTANSMPANCDRL